MEAILSGGSNCRAIKIDNDEDLTFEITSLIQGGLKINEAPEKLEESSEELKDRAEAVVVHVGTFDNPWTQFQPPCQKPKSYVKYITKSWIWQHQYQQKNKGIQQETVRTGW